MTDVTNTPNVQAAVDQGKSGWGKWASGAISSLLTTYFLNWCSLHGLDFKLIGIPSEMVKAALDAALVGAFVWATPAHFVAAVKDFILFVKDAWRQWRDAWNSN